VEHRQFYWWCELLYVAMVIFYAAGEVWDFLHVYHLRNIVIIIGTLH
jgi:hypothetical protein